MRERFTRLMRWFATAVLLLAGLVLFGTPGHSQNRAAANPLRALRFRFVGMIGNRASAVAGVPGDPEVAYVGAASGGLWKTVNGGVSWKPVFDHEDVQAIGTIAIAPSEHNVVWVGTGEPWLIRVDHQMGDGVYKSTDAGRTWQHMGLVETGHIARIVIDPRDPNRVFACAVGQAYRPQHQRGIFRTLDGGKTWQQVLFVNEGTGCSELAMDPKDPNTLFAGMWQLSIKPWKLDSGGPAGGVYVTHDGGNTWKKLSGHGLPPANEPLGKTAVAIAPSNPNRVYALIEEKTPSLYRSSDGGKTWTLVNQSHVMDERAPYYTRLAVSPDNENLLYFPSVSFSISRDGGKTLFKPGFGGASAQNPGGQTAPGGDNHDIWIDPQNASRIMVANDGGGHISLDHGRSYQPVVLPIAQFYHVYADNAIPYHVMGNRQDGPAFRGPSDTLAPSGGRGGAITTGYWTITSGCESGWAVPDPVDSNIVWSGCYNGMLSRMNYRTGQARNVTPWPEATYGWAPAKVKYRWNWTFPIAISPEDHNRVFVGSQYVHETTDGGQTWKIISPDLTLNDKSHQQNSGGIATDNLMTFDGATLYAIAESPVKAGVIWTGSNDGQVNVTLNGGAHWTNVTKNIPGLARWGMVTSIQPSHFDAGTAYISVSLMLVGNYNPYIYKTTDYGKTWTLISGGIPKSVSSFVHCVREDPVRKGMLYAGTDNALYVSWDDGGHWTRLRNNLPPAPVYWLTIQKHFNDLVIATYGRGIWILDDITPLRSLPAARRQAIHLFKPRAAYRFRIMNAVRAADVASHVVGNDPPYGADINFWLREPAKDAEIRILGPGNEEIRTLSMKTRAGLNRVWWDLRYDSAHTAKLRTAPPDAPWVKMGPKGWRPIVGFPIFDPVKGPMVPPGAYTVQLQVGGQQFTQPLEVLADPHSLGTPQTIRTEVHFLLGVRSELNEVVDMINRIEWTRKQIENLKELLNLQGPRYAPVVQAAGALENKAIDVEENLVDVHLSGGREDSFRNPMRLYGRLGVLFAQLDSDGRSRASGADLPPTAAEIAVNEEFQKRIAATQAQWKQFEATAAPAFNALLREHHLTVAIEP